MKKLKIGRLPALKCLELHYIMHSFINLLIVFSILVCVGCGGGSGDDIQELALTTTSSESGDTTMSSNAFESVVSEAGTLTMANNKSSVEHTFGNPGSYTDNKESYIDLYGNSERYENSLHEFELVIRSDGFYRITVLDTSKKLGQSDDLHCGILDDNNSIDWMSGTCSRHFETGNYKLYIYSDTGGEEFPLTYTVFFGADEDDDDIFDSEDNCIGLCPDRDDDGRADHLDNCPDIANKAQFDIDSDTIGNACDSSVDLSYTATIELPKLHYDEVLELETAARFDSVGTNLISKPTDIHSFLLNINTAGTTAILISEANTPAGQKPNYYHASYRLLTIAGDLIVIDKTFAEGDEEPWGYYFNPGSYILQVTHNSDRLFEADFQYRLELGTDSDSDFIMDIYDNCPTDQNYFVGDIENLSSDDVRLDLNGQADSDNDGIGDICDVD